MYTIYTEQSYTAVNALNKLDIPSSNLNTHMNIYNSMLLSNGIIEGKELENRIPLECNLDLLHSIDFNKGCYVGQELTARTKYQVCMTIY